MPGLGDDVKQPLLAWIKTKPKVIDLEFDGKDSLEVIEKAFECGAQVEKWIL